MLGQTVNDPDGIEGNIISMPGIGLLSIDTTMVANKVTQQVEFEFNGAKCKGYEIHQGISTTQEQVLQEGNCIGTYIHGFFDNIAVIDYILRPFNVAKANTPTPTIEEFKEQQYDLLADHVRRHVDIAKLYDIMSHD